MQTVIYIADTAPLQNDVLFAALYQSLPDYRRRKSDRYLVAGAKRLSLGVGILLKAACFEQGIPGADNDIVFGEQGKGYFKNVRNVFFNLSHSGERAMCVIAPVETGCDVQQDQKIHWSLKESFLKTEGKGFSAAPEESSLAVSGKKVSLKGQTEDRFFSFFEPNLQDGYHYACCLKKTRPDTPDDTEITVRQCDLTLPQFL